MALKYSTKDLVKKSVRFNKSYSKYLLIATVLIIISVVLSVYAPKILGKVINSLFYYPDYSQFDMHSILDELAILLVLYSAAYLIRIPVYRIMSKMSERVTADVKNSLYQKIDKIPLYKLNDEYSGNIMARLNNDTATIKSFINKNIAFIISNVLVIIAVIIMVIPMKSELSFIFMIMIPFYIVIMVVSYYKTKDYYKDFQEDLGYMMGFMGDYLSHRFMIRLYNAKDYINRRFVSLNDKQKADFVRSRLLSEVTTPIYLLLSYLIQIFAYIYAGYFVYKGVVSFGEFSVFVLYVQMFRKPMTSVSYSVNSIKSFFACVDRVSELIDYPVSEDKLSLRINKEYITGEIEFKNVSYNNITNFNLKINPGEVINVVGKNKNELVNLLLNFSKKESGEIFLDGNPISKLNLIDYANIFGVSIADDQIISGTIAENILLGSPDLDIDDVKRICDKLEISDIIERFPDKYDASISEDSITLSSGEKKLICVARALISNPKVVILNYPNYLSQDILHEAIKGKTVILLTPDENSVNFADKVILIN